ncbi:MAG: hypothetical protein EBU90_05970 [Proteobacteria bacterium]|nr:hypothetical protein [Pseudomonadota bacterium]NBP13994.1 hypothetical protein [bacterium]
MARTIQSPGVEIREVDLALRPVVNQGTSVFIAGFANQGPVDEILQPTSISDFEQVYGQPTNAAERYFYHTVKAALQAPIQLKVTRLPYGEARGEGFAAWRYSALVYPVVGVTTSGLNSTPSYSLSAANTYLLGNPTHLELDLEQYQELLNNNLDWSNNPSLTGGNSGSTFAYNTLGQAGVIILNRAQTTVNNKFEGQYIGLTDNNNNNPATNFDGILGLKAIGSDQTSINNYIAVPETRLNFTLSATKFGDGNSVSEVMENVSNYDLGNASFSDTLSLGLFKIRQSVFSPDVIALDYTLSESYAGSLDYHRQIASQQGGPAVGFFLGGQVGSTSPNIRVMVNPWISNQYADTWLGNDGLPTKKVRMLSNNLARPFNAPGFVDTHTSYVTRVGAASAFVGNMVGQLGATSNLYPIGIYTNTVTSNKNVGDLPAKLERAFELVENPDIYPINLACEAGLGTIFVNAAEEAYATGKAVSACGPFIESTPVNTLSALFTTNTELLNDDGLRIRSNYNAIASIFVNQAQNQRKDFLAILDPIRNIFIQGENSKVINTKKLWSPNAGVGSDPYAPGYVATNFSQHIYWPLRHQFSLLNTSYACTYANCAQVLDTVTNRQTWVPFSGFAAAAMGNTDANFQPWFAPAGFTRGVLTGVNDLGLYPKQKQRDQLYKISLNPVAFFPVEGFVIFGQKTLLKKPSAFDRINVRRLFLNLEIATRDTVKFYIFEPNTLFTRTQVTNVLTPIFENAKNTEGVYDYLIICDERNNTPEVIDNNELKVDIYLKPVRAAEFILVSFYATRTSQNFQEIVA